MKTQNIAALKKQSGVILILSLVILLVLTMLIVSSMNMTNTQVLMTGNTQYQTQALNDAESTLRFAEDSISQFSVSANARPATGYYNLKTNNTPAIDFKNFTWSPANAATYIIGSRNALYVIEYTGSLKSNASEYAPKKLVGDLEYTYRITARSTSGRGAARTVQSVFVAITPPL